MILRKPIKDPDALIRIGLLFLILASLARGVLHPSAEVPERLADGATGLLYGISIACMLLGVRMNARRGSTTHAGPCA
jgi:hypothetical protein